MNSEINKIEQQIAALQEKKNQLKIKVILNNMNKKIQLLLKMILVKIIPIKPPWKDIPPSHTLNISKKLWI